MDSKSDKVTRVRPNFSIRTLAIVVTFACCYLACWGPTKNQGCKFVLQQLEAQSARELTIDFPWGEKASMPLVVGVNRDNIRGYYFWFFGYVAKLPYEREVGWDGHWTHEIRKMVEALERPLSDP